MASLERPALLFSGGKDSAVLLRRAETHGVRTSLRRPQRRSEEGPRRGAEGSAPMKRDRRAAPLRAAKADRQSPASPAPSSRRRPAAHDPGQLGGVPDSSTPARAVTSLVRFCRCTRCSFQVRGTPGRTARPRICLTSPRAAPRAPRHGTAALMAFPGGYASPCEPIRRSRGPPRLRHRRVRRRLSHRGCAASGASHLDAPR